MSEAKKAASRRLYEEVFGRGNLAVADEILSPASVNHGPGTPPDVGTEFIKRQAALLRGAMPDFRVSMLDQLAEGDRVASLWNGSGTFTGQLVLPSGPLTPNGATVSFDEMRIDRYEDGRIVESWFIPDRLTAWQTLGVLPRPTPSG